MTTAEKRELPNLPRKLTHSDPSTLCDHLTPILDFLLMSGNEIQETNVRAWGECDLEVNLKRPFCLSTIRTTFRIPHFLDLWEFADAHYVGREIGISCDVCKHTITCPKADPSDPGPTFTLLPS